jgi:hypothetical protein
MNSLQPLHAVERALIEIQLLLLNDPTIRKLLYYDTPDAIEKEAPTIQELADYIKVEPVAEFALLNYERNSFIMMDISNIALLPRQMGKNVIEAVGAIGIFTKLDLWLLKDKRLRTNAIADRIIAILHELKLSAVGPVNIIQLKRLNVSQDISGIVIGFSIIDDQTTTTI